MKRRGGYVRVKNLQQYQHYKDRNPPWVKLHQVLLEDYDFSTLADASKWHAVASILLASRTDNHIPADPEWISGKIGATEAVDLEALQVVEFIEVCRCSQCASKSLAVCTSEEEGEAEQRESRAEEPSSLRSEASCPEPARDADSRPPPVLTYPTRGKTKTWDLTETIIAEMQELYDGVDVLAECKRALAWVKANPDRRKTARGMRRFLNGWIDRSVNRGSASLNRGATRPRLEPGSEWRQDVDRVMRQAEEEARRAEEEASNG